MNRFIVVKTQFEAIHCWPGCPHDEVAFLRNPHRHVFYVTCKASVHHDDRDIEFIMLKHQVASMLCRLYGVLPARTTDMGMTSCEMICTDLLKNIPVLNFVSVFEDDENGAEVTR